MLVRFKNILCPVDFFSASNRAFEYAMKLAENYGANLRLLHVVSPIIPDTYASGSNLADLSVDFQKKSRLQLEKLKARAEKKNIKVSAEVQIGDIDGEIRRAIKNGNADLVVVGTHGRRGFERWVLGSVTERLIRHCPVPLLAIGSSGTSRMVPPAIARMVVTTDFSEGTSDAMAYACSIAAECQSKITLLHVMNDVTADVGLRLRDPLIRGIREKLDALVPKGIRDWCDVQTHVDTGTPWRVILKTIQSEKPGLLVMNVHGKGMLERALVGSTADRVLRGTSCPVLLIPPMKAAAKSGRAKTKRKAA